MANPRIRAIHEAASSAATDSYRNVPARLGDGTPNQTESGDYPMIRRSFDFMLFLSLYRGSWIVRKVVDGVAEDMLKDFPVLNSQITPKDVKRFDKTVKDTGTLEAMRSALKWGRLFGGGVGLICIKGVKDLSEPLIVDEIEPDSYRGLIALDRWSGVTPGSELISDLDNPKEFGLPMYYQCTTDAGTVKVHHSRVLRFAGRELPKWEAQCDQYWGLGEPEILFDELKKNDYASWNIISLLTRAQIMSVTDADLASKMSGLGSTNKAYEQYVARMEVMSQAMNNQGLMVLGKDGVLHSNTYSFGGVADVWERCQLSLAAASGIPFEILFGRQSGLGSNGESGLQVYYDSIEQKRSRELGPQVQKLMPVVCMSALGEVPDDLDYTWPPVRTMSNKDRAELADKTSTAIATLYNADLLTKKEARMEQKQASDANGLCSNITDEAIAATPDKFASELGGADMPPLEDESGASAADAAMVDAWGKGAEQVGPDARGTREDVAELMERRSFGELAKGYNFATYARHDGDIQITVRFANDVVKDVTAVFAGNDDRSKWGKNNAETRTGWTGLWEFAQAYGD